MGERSLHSFVEEATGESHLRVEHDFGDGFVRLEISEAERRQAAQDIQNNEAIVVELLRNSRDAHANAIYVASSREGTKRHLTVIDDGDGIPSSMHDHIFEPRVTSKLDSSHKDAWGLHGRGMALYSIAMHADCARVCASEPGYGCSIEVVTDSSRLPEKTDQSSFPTFERGEGNRVNVRGPRNILRTICEFAIEERNRCSVTVGSPTEIAAAMYAHGMESFTLYEQAFRPPIEALPLTKKLAVSADVTEFVEIATSMGLELSERTARRILEGEIVAPAPALDLIRIAPGESSRKTGGRKRGSKSNAVKLGREDIRAVSDAVCNAFTDLAEKYYLEDAVRPSVSQRGDRLMVSVPLVRKP